MDEEKTVIEKETRYCKCDMYQPCIPNGECRFCYKLNSI